jgi:hypothetical protein
MTSLPSCPSPSSDSSECNDNSGDDSCSRVADLGNLSGRSHSLFWIKYITSKIHNNDTTLQMYLSEQPYTILKQ